MAKKKIVWIEDDEEVISAFKPHFGNQGWEVLSASSAEKDKALALEVKPDLIIMDIIMAGEHGYAGHILSNSFAHAGNLFQNF